MYLAVVANDKEGFYFDLWDRCFDEISQLIKSAREKLVK